VVRGFITWRHAMMYPRWFRLSPRDGTTEREICTNPPVEAPGGHAARALIHDRITTFRRRWRLSSVPSREGGSASPIAVKDFPRGKIGTLAFISHVQLRNGTYTHIFFFLFRPKNHHELSLRGVSASLVKSIAIVRWSVPPSCRRISDRAF